MNLEFVRYIGVSVTLYLQLDDRQVNGELLFQVHRRTSIVALAEHLQLYQILLGGLRQDKSMDMKERRDANGSRSEELKETSVKEAIKQLTYFYFPFIIDSPIFSQSQI